MTCDCANPYVHLPKDCRCDCGRLLRTHPPLEKPEWKTWRTTHGAQPQFAQRGEGITITRRVREAA